MTELPLLRFIPFRRGDIARLCLAQGMLDEAGQQQFSLGREHIEQHFQREFHLIKQELKDAYAPLDPDADTRVVEKLADQGETAGLVENLTRGTRYAIGGWPAFTECIARANLPFVLTRSADSENVPGSYRLTPFAGLIV